MLTVIFSVFDELDNLSFVKDTIVCHDFSSLSIVDQTTRSFVRFRRSAIVGESSKLFMSSRKQRSAPASKSPRRSQTISELSDCLDVRSEFFLKDADFRCCCGMIKHPRKRHLSNVINIHFETESISISKTLRKSCLGYFS